MYEAGDWRDWRAGGIRLSRSAGARAVSSCWYVFGSGMLVVGCHVVVILLLACLCQRHTHRHMASTSSQPCGAFAFPYVRTCVAAKSC